MKPGRSSLNPYAASYIPLSRRGMDEENKSYELTGADPNSGNQTVWQGQYPGNTTQIHHPRYSQNYDAHPADISQIPENFKLKSPRSYGSYGSSSHSSQELLGKQSHDDYDDMNLAYLQMAFPGISDESLSGVYMANRGDIDDTVDMLNQLESYPGDTSENLPDTLDIGDVPEAGSSSEAASQKLKKVASEEGSGGGGADSWTQSLPPN